MKNQHNATQIQLSEETIKRIERGVEKYLSTNPNLFGNRASDKYKLISIKVVNV